MYIHIIFIKRKISDYKNSNIRNKTEILIIINNFNNIVLNFNIN